MAFRNPLRPGSLVFLLLTGMTAAGCDALLPAARCSSDGDCADGRTCQNNRCLDASVASGSSGGVASSSAPASSRAPSSGSPSSSSSVSRSSSAATSASSGGSSTATSTPASSSTVGPSSSSGVSPSSSAAATSSSAGAPSSSMTWQCTQASDCPTPLGLDAACVTASCEGGSCLHVVNSGAACGTMLCDMGVLYDAPTCMAGACPPRGDVSRSGCGAYACTGTTFPACLGSCSSERDCSGTNLCVDMQCLAPRSLGTYCVASPDCDSGACACGNADCTTHRCAVSPCACNVAGVDGQCTAGFILDGVNPANTCGPTHVCNGAGGCGLP